MKVIDTMPLRLRIFPPLTIIFLLFMFAHYYCGRKVKLEPSINARTDWYAVVKGRDCFGLEIKDTVCKDKTSLRRFYHIDSIEFIYFDFPKAERKKYTCKIWEE